VVLLLWSRETTNLLKPTHTHVTPSQPEQTSTHQYTMQDGWYVDRKHFLLYSCPLANHHGWLCIDYLHVSTYLLVTKCLTLCTFLPTYIITTYIAYLFLLMIFTHLHRELLR
jgi:hypothetical protein